MGEQVSVNLESGLADALRAMATRAGRDLEAEIACLVRQAVADAAARQAAAWEAFDTIADGLFEGPGDLADRHDEYLYGAKPWPS